MIQLINNLILYFFEIIYIFLKIETLEDKFHNHKKNHKQMNTVMLKFKNDAEYNIVKNNIFDIMDDPIFLNKFDVTRENIIENSNNKIGVVFKDNCIRVSFNHYYISGPNMFIILNRICGNNKVTFQKTNPLVGMLYLPLYFYDMMFLTKKTYLKGEQKVDVMVEKNIKTTNKRAYLSLSILKKIYESLQLDRPMIAAFPIAFDDLPYIRNNVGIIIIKYEITDTIETLDKKIKSAYYQCYCSNFIVNCPLPHFGNIEFRNYVDCIVSSMYIKSDFDFEIAWDCSKPPVEELYAGSVSILKSNNTMDINFSFNTCSSEYKNNSECIEFFK